MINYLSWPRKRITTTNLRLDLQNPRLSNYDKNISQADIIEYLINNEKIYDLAIDIVTKGYFLNELPIVTKENGKYNVLEGNRRVSALKLLINPDLIKSSIRKNNIKKHLKNFNLEDIEKIECIIAPTREDADVMIVNRHTGGSVVERWDKTKQDRFISNRFKAGESIDEMASKFTMSKSDIKKSIKRYNVYEELTNLELDDSIKKKLLDETTFSMTNIERAYEFKEGIEFMGFEFDNNNYSIRKKLPKDEFIKRMSRIAADAVQGNLNSRILNTESDKKRYFDTLFVSDEFDKNIIPNISYSEDEIKVQPVTPPLPIYKTITSSKSNKLGIRLIPSNIYLVTGVERIDKIFDELKSLNIRINPNAVGVLFRSYIDMLSYQYLKKKSELDNIKIETINKFNFENDKNYRKIKSNLSKIDSESINNLDEDILRKVLNIQSSPSRKNLVPSLKQMLDYISSSDILITDDKLKQALQGYIRNNTSYLGHYDLNLLVHNEYYPADYEALQKAWNQIYPILEHFVIEIKK